MTLIIGDLLVHALVPIHENSTPRSVAFGATFVEAHPKISIKIMLAPNLSNRFLLSFLLRFQLRSKSSPIYAIGNE